MALASFALRFSDLVQVETACKEDENSRAGRAIDWLGARVARKATEWLGDGARAKSAGARTAWWDELRRCAEGDVAPSRAEGWNHPAASAYLQSRAVARDADNILLPQSYWPHPRIPQNQSSSAQPRRVLGLEESFGFAIWRGLVRDRIVKLVVERSALVNNEPIGRVPNSPNHRPTPASLVLSWSWLRLQLAHDTHRRLAPGGQTSPFLYVIR